MGLIPVLGLLDGRTVIESSAIVAFLTDAHSDKELAPPIGSGDHAIYLSALAFMSTNIYNAIDLAYDADRLTETPEQAAAMKVKVAERQAALFDVIENRLAKEGPHLVGERFSAADLYLFMLATWASPSERALLERCPNIARIAATVRARPRLKAALESHGVLETGA